MKPTTMTVRPAAGRRFTAARLVTDADGNAHVVIDEEDAGPRLLTPRQRAKTIPFDDRQQLALWYRECVVVAIAEDRDDTWEKACKLPRYIAVQHEQERRKRGDWNCIALEDLEKLLKGTAP